MVYSDIKEYRQTHLTELVVPTGREVNCFLLETERHSINVEYFIYKLGIEGFVKDPDRPHDISGKGNKYEWDVLKGLALFYREMKVDRKYIQPSIIRHDSFQYHHKIFGSPKIGIDFISQIGEIDYVIGAVDANCCMVENRRGYGEKHSFDDIPGLIADCTLDKTIAITELLRAMRTIQFPKTAEIISLFKIPHIDLPSHIMDRIVSRTMETVNYLIDEKNYDKSIFF